MEGNIWIKMCEHHAHGTFDMLYILDTSQKNYYIGKQHYVFVCFFFKPAEMVVVTFVD